MVVTLESAVFVACYAVHVEDDCVTVISIGESNDCILDPSLWYSKGRAFFVKVKAVCTKQRSWNGFFYCTSTTTTNHLNESRSPQSFHKIGASDPRCTASVVGAEILWEVLSCVHEQIQRMYLPPACGSMTKQCMSSIFPYRTRLP